MIILFYVSGIVSVLSTISVIFSKNPIYAVFYLILSLLAVSLNLFSLQAPFAGAVEIIIYAGAIMVLFVFVIMMFNMKNIDLDCNNKKLSFLPFNFCLGILLLMGSLLIILLCSFFEVKNCFINVLQPMMSLSSIGIKLFSQYMLVVEMASFLLLSALVTVVHIAQSHRMNSHSDSNQS